MSGAFDIPQLDGTPMRWDYFMLEAARGSMRVPDWVLLALPCVVAERFGITPDAVTDDDVKRFAAALPEDPRPTLRAMLRGAELALPDPATAALQLHADAVRGHRRAPVGFPDLAHDAALLVQRDYSEASFYAAFDAGTREDWDARYAVAAIMYLMAARSLT